MPEKAGLLQTPEMTLHYFSPKEQRYNSLSISPLNFTVLGTASSAQNTTDIKRLETDQHSIIRPYKQTKEYFDWQMPLLIIFLLGHALYWSQYLITAIQKKTSPNYQIEKQRHKHYQRILNTLKTASPPTLNNLQKSLFEFIELGLEQPLQGASYTHLKKTLEQSNLSKESSTKTLDLLQNIDQLSFQTESPSQSEIDAIRHQLVTHLIQLKKEFSSC